MLKKLIPIIPIVLSIFVVILVLSCAVFVKPEPVVPVQMSLVNNDVTPTTTPITIPTTPPVVDDAIPKIDSSDWEKSEVLASYNSQKIVWEEHKFQKDKTNSRIIVADSNGQNKKLLLEKNFEGEEYFKPIKWSNSNEEIYFVNQPEGIGGYIIFGGTIGLSKINIYTGKIEYLFENGYIGDISPNEEFISYFTGGDDPKLVIRDIKTDKENIFDIPIDENFRGGGNAFFSPDSKYLAYNIAHWDPNDEYYRVIVVSSTEKEQKTIVDDPKKIYEVKGWFSNNQVLLRDLDNIYYIINTDGSNLRKKQ